MNFKHTRRSGFLFVFLSIITLSIYSLVVLSHVSKEVESLGGKKRAPYVAFWLLGWITLGIVPLCYFASLSREVGAMAEQQGIQGKTTYGSMFNWNLFGILILVGPFIAWSKFLHVLNRLEAAKNEASEEAPKQAEVAAEAAEEPSPSEAPEEEAIPALEAPKAEEVPEAVGEPGKEEEEKAAPSPKMESHPAWNEAPENARWRVRYGKKAKDVAVFATREEALAFAKGLSLGRGGKSRIKVRAKGE